MENIRFSLKLLIDNHAERVLFAEASKDFVDFLFHLPSLPIATAISLLRKQGMEGPLANLYNSIENLHDSYVQPNQCKETLLKPSAPPFGSSVPLPLLDGASTGKMFYGCNQFGHYYVSDDPRADCPKCRRQMTLSFTYVAPPPPVQQGSAEGGFVKGVVTYMVMDDLVVKPMSTISCISLLSNLNVRDVGSLEEKVVELGADEAVSLLRASFKSEKVLTDVFWKSKSWVIASDW